MNEPTFDFSTLSDRQKLGLVCYYAIKYGRFNDKGVLIPPPEFGDSFDDFDEAMAQHYGNAVSTVSRLCDYMIARFPAINQNGYRIKDDPDVGRRPQPLGAPLTVVYTAAKLMGREDLWHNVIVRLVPRPYSRRTARTTSGFTADDNNTKPRQRPNAVKGTKKPKTKKSTTNGNGYSFPLDACREFRVTVGVDGDNKGTLIINLPPKTGLIRHDNEVTVVRL